MLDDILQIVAPHYCYGCGKSGAALCANCKYNIVSEPFSGCIVCQKPVISKGICVSHASPIEQAWCVSTRTEVVESMLNGYKFEREKATHTVLAALLDDVLPNFSTANTIVVPIPTITQHVRQRGYDHTLLIAKRFAKQRKLQWTSSLLVRKTNTKQLGASKKQRIEQAKGAFMLTRDPDLSKMYILIDDIVTTGSTIEYAARALRAGGAEHVWVAVIARQPLDK